ncbi:MAG: hypothetical protein IT162_14070 [Bryobacterales bacterium]|nr:hypothetical protein [Bryobacterales bacterium]
MRTALAALALLPASTMWAAVHAPSGAGAVGSGFEHFYNLEYDEAVAVFRRAIEAQPAAPALHNHLAQAILYRAFYRSGLLEESIVSGNDPLLSVIRLPKLRLTREEDCEFQQAIETAMSLSRHRLRIQPDDTGALFALGSAHALRANYKFLVKKAWISALRDAGAGLGLHNRVVQLEPGNVDARLLQGMHDYVLAKLPLSLRLLGAVAGMRGNKDRGLRTIAMVAGQGATKREEAGILLAAIYRHERQLERSAELLAPLAVSFPKNHLLSLVVQRIRMELPAPAPWKR